MKQLRFRGQYRGKPKLGGLTLLLITMFIGWYIKINNDPQVLYSPMGVAVVRAEEPVVAVITQPLTVEEKIRLAFPEDSNMAVKVAFCESSLNPNAKSKGSTASGLFQIIRGTWRGYKCGDNPFDADQNIACARKIYNRNGWGSSASWEASKPCWSK